MPVGAHSVGRALRARDLADLEAGGVEQSAPALPTAAAGQALSAPSVSVTSRTDVGQLGPRTGVEGDRSGEVGRDTEVGTDAPEDLVDVERSELLSSNAADPHQKSRCMGWSRRSTSRSPARRGRTRPHRHNPPGRAMRGASRLCAGDRATSQVCSPPRRPSAMSGLDRWEGDDQIPDARTRSAPRAPGPSLRRWRRAVRSSIPATAKPSRRSAHLLHRPQWRPSTGAMQEKVCSSSEVTAKLEDLGLRQACERRPHLERVVETEFHERPEERQNSGAAVGEGVALQRSEGDDFHAIERAPDAWTWTRARGCGPAGTRRCRGWCRQARPCPTRSNARHTRRRSGGRARPAGAVRGRPAARPRNRRRCALFGCLPREAEPDVERLHDPALSGQVGDQDRAVDPAAGEDGEGPSAGHGSPR